jgi:hypothetical protein
VRTNYEIDTVLLDQEVYSSSGKKVFQQVTHLTLRAGRATTIAQVFTLPASAARGSYSYKIGVFGLNWTPSYTWNDSAGSFIVE